MIDDKMREEIINAILQSIHKGSKLNDAINELRPDYADQFTDPTQVKPFWKGVAKDVKRQMKGSDVDVQGKAIKEATSMINRFFEGVDFKGKQFKTRGLDKLSEISDTKKHRLGMNKKFNKDMDSWEKELEAIKPILEKAGKRNLYPILERVFETISIQIFNKPSDGSDSQRINMIVENFYSEIGEVDFMKADDRESMYMFWERIQDKYPELVNAIVNLKKKLQELRPDDADYQRLVAELEAPPPYIKHIGIVKKNFNNHVERVIELVARLGGQKPKITEYSRQHDRTKPSGETRPELSQRSRAKSPGGARDDRAVSTAWESEGEQIPLDIHTVELELDPILWHNINTEAQEIQAGMGGDIEDILEELEEIKLDLPEGDQRELLEDLITELKSSVKDSGIVTEIDEITKETGKFFSILNRLFLESGKLPVTMSPKVGGPQRGAAGGSVQVGTKDDPQQFRKPREQGTPSEIPSPKQDEYVKEVEEEFEALMELINSYYFHPLSKGKFVDGKPEFVDEGGMDFGEEFDPDATTQEGRYPYRAMELNFGTHPKAVTLQNMLRAIDDNFFDTELLEELIDFIKLLKGGFSSVEGWENYVREMEVRIKTVLDELLPDFKEDNRIWGAGKIGEALLAHQSNKLLSELKFFNKPLDEFYQEYLAWGDKDLPLSNIRSILQSPEFENLMRGEKENSSKEDYDSLDKSVEKILELTEPKTEEGVKERIDVQEDRIGKSLLNVHDYINKMKGLPIYYGKLNVNDVDDIDYLINKIESEDKVEINCIEITGIVNSIDSHNNISKSFGFNESIVYKIKGLRR